ncbi:phosphoadenosine phosphosulfate reductase [Amycolatopsis australiensis]|uniref:3'-phosphoadenosine 5'-phosphosulfate sulfotransferase (PAPS reductase)/FAD synthetase n=1 Tax=Amycolatopsis australiensis TaxID=546364 RepID=A0A1K1LSV4_9PSEU|nr:phosphoadenosine phosphosulfate reductase [Amycolatopsis australiensis]SFW12726.1 3'-phosphoadenosine 5'-phosphosulfate sulfotransferase (PAPS reductase)/FAD synthetase [Amycolatopsis australiensis]
MTLSVISYGGGVQSTAMLVLAAQGHILIDAALFANVGDDSEHPATLRYVRDVAEPWATKHGLALHVLDRVKRDGTTETLWQRLTRPGSRSLPIPVRMSNGAPGTRSCTADFKIRVIGKWLRAHGASAAAPATVNIGISVDEIHRANTRRVEPHEHIVYPLLDLRMRRTDCARLIAAAGLPVPPKSACWFCPYHRPSVWATMRAEEPALFNRACHLEDLLNARRAALGKDAVYLTRFGRPLRDVVDPGVQLLPLLPADTDSGCDSGWCMT